MDELLNMTDLERKAIREAHRLGAAQETARIDAKERRETAVAGLILAGAAVIFITAVVLSTSISGLIK